MSPTTSQSTEQPSRSQPKTSCPTLLSERASASIPFFTGIPYFEIPIRPEWKAIVDLEQSTDMDHLFADHKAQMERFMEEVNVMMEATALEPKEKPVLVQSDAMEWQDDEVPGPSSAVYVPKSPRPPSPAPEPSIPFQYHRKNPPLRVQVMLKQLNPPQQYGSPLNAVASTSKNPPIIVTRRAIFDGKR